MFLLAIPPFFLMHFREAKLPVHVLVESVVVGSSLPQILAEPEHLKHIDALINLQEQYCAKATQSNLCAQTKENDNYKEQGCQNEYLKSHSPEHHKILEPGAVVFSEHFTSMEVRSMYITL